MGWATFWATFSQLHLVTLMIGLFESFLFILFLKLPPHTPTLVNFRSGSSLSQGKLKLPGQSSGPKRPLIEEIAASGQPQTKRDK
jgi:hypothetical protein